MITVSIKEDANKVIKIDEDILLDADGALYKSVVEAIERPLIQHVLERTSGNQLKAARILGINRNTIRVKIKKLSIDLSKWKA
jgi:two-component system nitrogen regulation response regulator GlnG